MTGAEALVRSLIAQKTQVIFGYPGGAIMPVYDALYQLEEQYKLHHVLVRHEQAAIHAAEGYAKSSGYVGVCMATSGPGATNLLTGLTDAYMDSVAVVCIVAQVASQLIGTDAFQEADMLGMSVPCTKWSYQISSAKEIAHVVAKAFKIAKSNRPGPVLIEITKDAQLESCYLCHEIEKSNDDLCIANDHEIAAAIDLINQAKQPLLLVGQGVLLAKAVTELEMLTTKNSIPVVTTLLGLSAMPDDHPLYFGMVGMHGHYGPNVLTNEADLIIAVGMRFDDRVTGNVNDYARGAKIIHIDIDHTENSKIIKSDIFIHADAKAVLYQLYQGVNKQ